MPLDEETKRKLDGLRDDPLQQSINQAVRMGSPDQNAQVLQYAQEQQLPIDTVQRNLPEVDARHHVNQIDVEAIKRDYPVVADFMRDPTNAAVSIDDLDNLQQLEHTLRDDDIDFVPNTARGFVSRLNKIVGDLIEFGGTIHEAQDEFKESLGIPTQGFVIGDDGISWSWDTRGQESPSILSVIGQYISEGEAHRVGYKPNFTWENLKGDVTPTNLAGYAIEQGVQSLPDMAATIAVLPAYIASRTQDIAEQRAQNDSRADADLGDIGNSLVVATAVSLLERIGAKSVFDLAPVSTLTEGVTAVGEAVVKEGLTEFVQEGVEYYGETLGTRTETDSDVALDRALAGLVAGGTFGGAIRTGTATVEGISNRINRESIQLAESIRGQEQLDNVIALAQSSKTNERAQDKFKQFLRGAGKERAVHINSQDVLDLVQAGETIPDYLINEAMQNSDGEIAIPLEDFALDSDMIEVLRPYVRFAPDQLSTRDIENYEPESVQDLIERAAQTADIKTEADEIYEQVKEQLINSGRHNETTAKWMGSIIPAYVAKKAEETGLSPMEVYKRMNFNVVGPSSVPQAPDANVLSQAEESGYEGDNVGEAAEWLAAIEKGLDMSTKARMERARDMGFDTDQIYYHGTARDGYVTDTNISEFDPDKVGDRWRAEDTGFFFTTDSSEASYYGSSDRDYRDPGAGAGAVYPVVVKTENPLIINSEFLSNQGMSDIPTLEGNVSFWDTYQGLIRDWVNEANADSVIIEESDTGRRMGVIFDPTAIRSVNAAFDPDQADSPNLLAQTSTLIRQGDVDKIETGVPVTFDYAHNPESATGLFGLPQDGDQFGRDIEPSGRYVTITDNRERSEELGLETGRLTLSNPLVVLNNELQWKQELSNQYGGKTGSELSQALIADGYDGVITHEENYISEILDLTTFDESLALYQSLDLKESVVTQRDDGKFEITGPIDDFDYRRIEEVEETGEQVEITESARDYVRRLDKEIGVVEKLLNCMKS